MAAPHDTMRTINGACHCRNMRFVLTWPADENTVAVRKCGCTFCCKHGGAWTSNRSSALDIDIDDESLLSRYRFGTATAEFYVCSACGVVPVVISNIDGQRYAVVNTNSFEDISDLTLICSDTDFDGEDTGSRLERRKRNWIANVRLQIAGVQA